jgi:hypothetical protein
MIRFKSLALGVAVFVLAHVIQVSGWDEWFQAGGSYPPWFLNSGRAVAFTAGLLFVAGVLIGLAGRGVARDSIVGGANLAVGAAVAMAVVLAWIGPGTLFPIALTIGAAVAFFSSIVGALAGSVIASRAR